MSFRLRVKSCYRSLISFRLKNCAFKPLLAISKFYKKFKNINGVTYCFIKDVIKLYYHSIFIHKIMIGFFTTSATFLTIAITTPALTITILLTLDHTVSIITTYSLFIRLNSISLSYFVILYFSFILSLLMIFILNCYSALNHLFSLSLHSHLAFTLSLPD